MIDTLKIWFDLEQPLEDELRLFPDGLNSSRTKCIYKDEVIQIFPFGHGNHPARLSVQTSLPKFVHEHNALPLCLDETRLAMQSLQTKIAKSLKLDRCPAMEDCHVSRADFVYDWKVDCPEAYLSVLERFAMVRGNHSLMVWKNGQDKGTTIKVGSSQQKLIAYNKEAEVAFRARTGFVSDVERELAKGRLRAEYSVQKRAWNSVIGKTSPTMAELDSYLSAHGHNALAAKWSRFTDGWGESSLEESTVKLVHVFGKKRGRQLAETLAMVRAMGANKYKQICSPSPSTWYQFRKALRVAGVSLTDSGGLVRLEIPMFKVEGANG
jgi:hypothetical protein